MTGAAAIRVVMAEDHSLMRAGLRQVLGTAPDIVLVGEAVDGDEAQRLCRVHQPDVLLLDLQMPGPPAAATVAAVREQAPRTRVLVVTLVLGNVGTLAEVTALGVGGYLLKDELLSATLPAPLVQAVRTVAGGGQWFSPRVAP